MIKMPANQLEISDERMLQLIEYAVPRLYPNEKQYLEAIGYSQRNIRNVRAGHQSFRISHIREACTITGADANWVLGISEKMLQKGLKTRRKKREKVV